MNLRHLIVREILHHKLSFVLVLLAVTVAAGVFTAEIMLLRAHDLETEAILGKKEARLKEELRKMEDDYRKIMKELGFNLLILPKGQRLDDFYAEGYASRFMPEEYVKKLAASDIVTIRHLLPSIEQKVRWPEQSNRTIIVIGTRGEVPFLHRDPKEPILVAVPPGEIVLGYEIWSSLGLRQGDTVSLMGSRFTVSKCHPQRGTKDDITVWIDLKTAQNLLGTPGKINAIQALKCHCAGADIAGVRDEITSILPDVEIIEFENKVVTRAKARDRAKAIADSTIAAETAYRFMLRKEKESFAAWFVPLIILCCAALIGLLTFHNVRDRRGEIGILRAIGLTSNQILLMFLVKILAIGLAGACAGCLAGMSVGLFTGSVPVSWNVLPELFNPSLFAVIIVITPLIAGFAGWLPALAASRVDPAVILSEE